MYVCHAEMNAIMNKNSASVEGCTIYVALFPCNECAKMIIQVARRLSRRTVGDHLDPAGGHQGGHLLLGQARPEEQHHSQ